MTRDVRRWMDLFSRPALLGVLALVLFSAMTPASADAQSAKIHHKVEQWRDRPPTMGRDLWFMMLTNYAGNTGAKYYALYVTSPNATTVWVQQTGGVAKPITVKPFKTTTFNMPLSWETQSSGKVENKGVHVWSNDADICCYVMSHNDATSDGFYVYPLIGWGKEYVVGGYNALLAGRGTQIVDQPSEFGIISNTDKTTISMTPTQDIRVETGANTDCASVFARKNVRTTITLDRDKTFSAKPLVQRIATGI